jgi:hypothetical protein
MCEVVERGTKQPWNMLGLSFKVTEGYHYEAIKPSVQEAQKSES